MEFFPVEVIDNILSRLEDARDVVIASFTCRKWREAWRNHLHKLTFNSDDWPVCDEHMTRRFEVIITQTIFQTNALQCLSITMKKDVVLSAAPVIAWLLYTRETLRQLHFSVNTPNLNILEKCGHQRLELLDLAEITISRVEFSYQKFSCLRSLSLDHVTISALDLSRLVTACPKVEVLNLVCLDFDGPWGTMKLHSNSLKDIHVQGIHLDHLNEIILDTDSLEKLQIKDCDLGIFKLLSKGTLRLLEMDDVYSFPLDIGTIRSFF